MEQVVQTPPTFGALTLLVGRQEGHPAFKKTEYWGAGVVICLERGADLHMARLMPLPLTVSCLSKIQIGFTFLVPAHLGSPGKGPLNVCVCVCCRQTPAVVESPFLSIVRAVPSRARVVPGTRVRCGHAPGERSGLYLGLRCHPFTQRPLNTAAHQPHTHTHTRVVASTQSFKYQYKYQYLSLKYQYKYPVLQP